jgi:hypothetical protein
VYAIGRFFRAFRRCRLMESYALARVLSGVEDVSTHPVHDASGGTLAVRFTACEPLDFIQAPYRCNHCVHI